MLSGRIHNRAGYAQLATALAKQAVAVARDAAPHRAREGERRWPMARALPAARALIGEAGAVGDGSLADAARGLAQALADPGGKSTDGFGHHRPAYACLAVHLLGTAARLNNDHEALAHVKAAAEHAIAARPEAAPIDPRQRLWHRLIAWQHGRRTGEPSQSPGDGPAPLAPLGRDDLIDAWTYHELVGLHALHQIAQLTGDEQAKRRAASAAAYHLGHTQPDYTTYQPWALAVFASDQRTAGFAEQQLHDVATHLSIEGPGGAVLPALLLADAAATLNGAVSTAWHGD